MSATPELFEVMALWADGVLIAEAQEIDTTVEADDTVVKTILLDFPGITPGPSMRTVHFKNVMSSSGPSIDFEAKKINKEPTVIRLQRLGSGAACEMVCFIQGNVSTTSGVGKNMDQDVTVIGAANAFQ
jgi:hypothetical protein